MYTFFLTEKPAPAWGPIRGDDILRTMKGEVENEQKRYLSPQAKIDMTKKKSTIKRSRGPFTDVEKSTFFPQSTIEILRFSRGPTKKMVKT